MQGNQLSTPIALGQMLLGTADLTCTGKKDQHVAAVVVRIGPEPAKALLHLFFKARAWFGVQVTDAQGEQAALGADDRAVAQKSGDRLGIEGGGHDDHTQVVAQTLHLAQHRQRQIRVDRALVKLVEDHAADVLEQRIAH